MKAQVDFSNIDSQAKVQTISWGMPDYTAGVAVAALPFVAPSAGVVIASLRWSASDRYVTVNGYKFVDQFNVSDAGQKSSGMILVNAGDRITINTGNISHFEKLTFFPMKGVK